jgi:glycosyltransferase involved in cell wall biosynthesis
MIILDIALYALVVVVLIQVFFHLYILGTFAFSKTQHINKNSKTPVSVIICAKNEAENLRAFLPSIVNQEYHNFEIVLINDNSYDETLDIMEGFSKNYKNIKIVNAVPVETFWGNKKYPLTLGIKAATHNVLLFTDADCKPVSKYWIKEMVSNFDIETSIVLGYGGYMKVKNSILNKLIRFETLSAATSYLSFAKIGIPYMGVGRNLAYTKTQFFKVNGFMKHMRIRSGDDDLFINEAATRKNTRICVTKNSFTLSNPKTSFKNWFRQKRRHVSTANHYKLNHKVLLTLFYSSSFLFWILAIALLGFGHKPIYVGILVFIRCIAFLFTYGYSAKKLNEKDLIMISPFLEIFLIIFQLAIFINNIISKPNHWK